jgi:hypothetical protein
MACTYLVPEQWPMKSPKYLVNTLALPFSADIHTSCNYQLEDNPRFSLQIFDQPFHCRLECAFLGSRYFGVVLCAGALSTQDSQLKIDEDVLSSTRKSLTDVSHLDTTQSQNVTSE